MINNTAIFPGSFDPITRGHVDIIKRALRIFDGIIIAIGINPRKKHMFSADERIMMINKVFEKNPKIHITKYTNLTIDICQKYNTNNIIRGIRSSQDFEYEQLLSFANQRLNPNIETFFLSSNTDNISISSSIVKDIILSKGPIEKFIPFEITSYIKEILITKEKN